VHQLFIDFKKAYSSVTREVLYNILLEFGIPKQVRLIKMCFNEAYSKVHVGKLLPDTFPTKNGLKQGDGLQQSPRKSSQFGIEWDTSAIGLC
jgi:hypothetical protein